MPPRREDGNGFQEVHLNTGSTPEVHINSTPPPASGHYDNNNPHLLFPIRSENRDQGLHEITDDLARIFELMGNVSAFLVAQIRGELSQTIPAAQLRICWRHFRY